MRLSLQCYVKLQPALELHPVTAPLASNLFHLIDTTCKHWVFPTVQSRMEVVVFSQRLRQALKQDDQPGDKD